MTPLDQFFANLDRSLSLIPDDGYKASYINRQIEAWEDRERQLWLWAQRDDDSSNPFKPPISAIMCTTAILRLHAMIGVLREKTKAQMESVSS